MASLPRKAIRSAVGWSEQQTAGDESIPRLTCVQAGGAFLLEPEQLLLGVGDSDADASGMAVRDGSPRGTGAGGASAGNLWCHDGNWLPRGTIALSQVTDDDLARLDAGSIRRRGTAFMDSPPTPRPVADEQQLQALCEWLHGHGLDLMGVVTFSDDYADRYGIHSLKRAMQDVWRGLHDIPMGKGDNVRCGYPWKFVLAGEHHRTGRSVPHVHVALESHGAPVSKLCFELYDYFYRTRGRARFEPMRDVDSATLYGLKDSVKASKHDPDAFAARLWHPRRRRRFSGTSSSSGGGDPLRS